MKIIVVGASSGIGHLVGECLERRGDSVVGIARRDPSDWAGQFWTLMLSADASEETTLRDAFRQ
jgi:short-subunit dehydrogenase